MKKVHRFIGAYDLRATEIVLENDAAHQIASVLKMKTGERISLCDGKGHEAAYEILKLGKGSVGLARAGGVHEVEAEPETRVTLYAAILKRESFEWAVQKAVECGVAEIVPVVTDRTIKKEANVERLQAIAKEAAEQCGRGIVPTVVSPMKFGEAVGRANGMTYFFDVEGEAPLAVRGKDGVNLFIGPEGGWSEQELANAKRAGFAISSLGPRVLRGETACAIAVYLSVI
ncbi:MAG TPA: RsmE family RNA methyltransferase [Verrucomicrobiae bacterium]|nr:RsmE family RNA methyltransferase [Verrucomicrobiae bacterium]